MNWVRLLVISMVVLTMAMMARANTAQAAEGRYASIIIDAGSLDILHAREIDARRHPASLTKIMTLYMTFEAIDQGRLSLDSLVTISPHAARTPPVSMGLKAGDRVRVDTLIQAVAVRSANDAATALAEAVYGNEAVFVGQMNQRAQQLGLRQTQFRNPHGLPNADQVTTARDMAKLAVATLQRFPHHYHYFGQTHFRGRKNTNALLTQRADVDGFKTGYTRASGYNLTVSAVQGEDRIIAVVLGGASPDSRNTHMSDLIDRGFEVINQPRAATIMASAPVAQGPKTWSLQIDGFDSPAEAAILAETFVRTAGVGTVSPKRQIHGNQPVFSIRINDLDQAMARDLCARQRDLLNIEPRRCKIVSVAQTG
ncbi:MAG: D-alanyl-D-alanine carboxypeptidase family protein [Pseudomonadota bacterium]